MNRNNNNVGCGGFFIAVFIVIISTCFILEYKLMGDFWAIPFLIFLFFAVIGLATRKNNARDYKSLLEQLKSNPFDSDTQQQILEIGRSINYTEERIRNDIEAATAASKKPNYSAPNVATEIEKLGKLFLDGVMTAAEFERGKTLFLGNPPDKAQAATKLLSELHQLHKRGALSESEFNSKKWDILAGKLI